MEPFTKIKGLSDIRRLPRLGKVKLGIKEISRDGKTYPKEVPYFILPPEARKIYGEKPTELDILFPIDDPAIIFPQRLEWWGAGGLKCQGDGARAHRSNDVDQREERICPCETLNKGCGPRGHLIFILPKVSVAGCYQIDVGSRNSIIDLNSGLDYLTGLIGRFSGIPLRLKRVLRETHGSGRKETHYPLQIFFEGDLRAVESLRKGRLSIPEHIVPDSRTVPAGDDEYPSPEEEIEMAKKRGMVTEGMR